MEKSPYQQSRQQLRFSPLSAVVLGLATGGRVLILLVFSTLIWTPRGASNSMAAM